MASSNLSIGREKKMKKITFLFHASYILDRETDSQLDLAYLSLAGVVLNTFSWPNQYTVENTLHTYVHTYRE